jgi:hypothetical protein
LTKTLTGSELGLHREFKDSTTWQPYENKSHCYADLAAVATAVVSSSDFIIASRFNNLVKQMRIGKRAKMAIEVTATALEMFVNGQTHALLQSLLSAVSRQVFNPAIRTGKYPFWRLGTELDRVGKSRTPMENWSFSSVTSNSTPLGSSVV